MQSLLPRPKAHQELSETFATVCEASVVAAREISLVRIVQII